MAWEDVPASDVPEGVRGPIPGKEQQAGGGWQDVPAEEVVGPELAHHANLGTNPEQEAEIQRLSRSTRIPENLIRKNLQNARDVEAKPDYGEIRAGYPTLFRSLSNHGFNAVTKDDVEALKVMTDAYRIGKMTGHGRAYTPGVAAKQTEDAIKRHEHLKSLPEHFKAGQATFQRGELGLEIMRAADAGEDVTELMAKANELQVGSETQGLLQPAAVLLGQMTSMGGSVVKDEGLQRALTTGMIGGTAAAAAGPGAPITTPTAFVSFASAQFASDMGQAAYKMEAGNAYLDLLEMKSTTGESMDHETAMIASQVYGSVSALLEVGGLGILASPFKKAVQNHLKQKTIDVLKSPTVGRAIMNAAKTHAKVVAGEAGVELAQETANMIAEEVAKVMSGKEFQSLDPEEAAERLAGVASEVIRGMAILAIPGTTTHFASEMRLATQAEQNQEFFQALGETPGQTKTSERLPQGLRDYVAELQKEGGAVEEIYIDAETMIDYFQGQAPDAMDQLDAAVPGLAEAAREAAAVGGNVKIDSADFAAHIAPVHGQALWKDIKLNDGDMSMNEAQAWRDRQEEEYQKLQEAAGLDRDQLQAFEESADAVFEDNLEQLQQSGRYTAQEAQAQATAVKMFFRTMAAREGMDPKDLYDSYGLSVKPGRPEQSDYDQSGKIDTTRKGFGEWFDGSAIVDKDGEPMITYHATDAQDIQAFDRAENDIGIHFGTAAQANDRAKFKAQVRTGGRIDFDGGENLIPVYLSIKNPLVLEQDPGSWDYWNLPFVLKNTGKFTDQEIRSLEEYEAEAGFADEDGAEQLMREFTQAARDLIESKGYDGIIYRNTGEIEGMAEIMAEISAIGSTDPGMSALMDRKNALEREVEEKPKWDDSAYSYVAFHPEQIKSVFNEGGFDPTDPRILFQALTQNSVSAIPGAEEHINEHSVETRPEADISRSDGESIKPVAPAEAVWQAQSLEQVRLPEQTIVTIKEAQDWLEANGYPRIAPKGETSPLIERLIEDPAFQELNIFDQIRVASQVERPIRNRDYNSNSIPKGNRKLQGQQGSVRGKNQKVAGSGVVAADTLRGCDHFCFECYALKGTSQASISHQHPIRQTLSGTIKEGEILRIGETGDPSRDWAWTDEQVRGVIQRSRAKKTGKNVTFDDVFYITKLLNVQGFNPETARNLQVTLDPLMPSHMALTMQNIIRVKAAHPEVNISVRIRSVDSNNFDIQASTDAAVEFANQFKLPIVETRMRFIRKSSLELLELNKESYKREGNQFKLAKPVLKEKGDKALVCDEKGGGCPKCLGCAKTTKDFRADALRDQGKVIQAEGIDGVGIMESAEIFDPVGGDVLFQAPQVVEIDIRDPESLVPEEMIPLIEESLSRPETYKIKTDERNQQRIEWVDTLMAQRGYRDPNDVPPGDLRQERKAILVLGLPASGKSGVSDPLVEEHGAMLLDSDEYKKIIPEFDNGNGASAVHEESSELMADAMIMSAEQGNNMVLPVVGGNIDSLKRRVQILKGFGYTVDLNYVDVPMNKAVERVVKRWESEGRLVNPANIISAGTSPIENYLALVEEGVVDGYQAYNNDVAFGEKPEAVETVWLRDQLERRQGRDGRTGAQAEGEGVDQAVGFQTGEGSPRGGIQMQPGKTDLYLLDNADLSTYLHETGHLFMKVMEDLAKRDGASEQLKKDWAAINKWTQKAITAKQIRKQYNTYMRNTPAFGGRDFDALSDVEKVAAKRKLQAEYFARGFEGWLLTAESPSPELRSAFAQFRSWLQTIYSVIRNLNITLSDQVSEVYARMFATDAEIAAAEYEMRYASLFNDAAAAGMTEAEFASYQKAVQAAREQAQDELQAEVMKQLQREQKDAYRQKKAEVKEQAEAELNEKPVYIAKSVLTRGKMPDGTEVDNPQKLSLQDLQDRGYDQKTLRKIPFTYTKEGGIDIDTAAQIFGFESGDEMINAMISAPPKQEALAEIVQERMQQIEPDVLRDPELMEQEAVQAVHSSKRGSLLMTELKRLAKMAGGMEVVPEQIIKLAAERIINGKLVRELRPDVYTRNEAKAGREVIRALADQDFEAAFAAQQRRILNHHLAKKAKEAKERTDKGAKKMRSLAEPAAQKRLAAARGEYLEQINAILDRYEFAKVSLKKLDERKSFAEWVREQELAGEDIAVDPELLAEARAINYKDLSVERMDGIVESVKHIEHLAKTKNKLLDLAEERDIDEAVDELVMAADENGKRQKKKPLDKRTMNKRDKLRNAAKEIDATLLKAEQLFDWLDGGDVTGPWSKYFWDAFAAAQNRENEILEQYLEPLAQSFITLTKERGAKLDDKVYIPALGESVTRGGLLSIGLNLGNDQNANRLIDGYGWSDAQVEAIIDKIEEADWKWIQETWDLIDSLWPEIVELERKVRGVPPKKVEKRPIPTKYGVFSGGYFPLVYDHTSIAGSKQLQGDTQALFEQVQSRATTPKGHTKERMDTVNAQVLLDLNVIPAHLSKVIHDLTHRTAVMNANKLLAKQDVRDAIKENLGDQYVGMLERWVKGVANDRAFFPEDGLGAWMKFFRRLRLNASVVAMGFKATTFMSQFAGFAQSLDLVKREHLATGIAKVTKSPRASADYVFSMSREMKDRIYQRDREVKDALRSLTGRTDVTAKVREMAFIGIGYADLYVSLSTWIGAYEQYMLENDNNQDGAIKFADRAVRLSQGSGTAKDLAQVQREGNEVVKMLTMFYSYFNALYARMRDMGWKAGSEDSYRRTVARAFYLIVIPAILSEILAGRGGGEEDENWMKWGLKTVLVYPFLTVPYVRDIVGAVESGFDYKFSPVVAVGEKITRTITDTGEAIAGDGDWDRVAKDVFEVSGYLFGLPTSQAKITGGFVYDVLTGEDDIDEPADMLGLIYRREDD